MADISPQKPVHVTGEERPHPALRKLARACLALVRWQRELEQQELSGSTNQDESPVTISPPRTGDDVSETSDQEGHHG